MHAVFNILSKIHDLIINTEKVLLCFILFAVILLSFFQVVARNVFSEGYFWIDIVLRHGVIWVAFLGASLATYYRQHIKIDVLSHFIYARSKKKTVDIGICIFQIIICALLAAGSVEYVLMLKQYPKYVFDCVPVWGLRLIVPYSFFMMMVSCVFQIITVLADKTPPAMELEAIDLAQS